jgi:hypothetical protein
MKRFAARRNDALPTSRQVTGYRAVRTAIGFASSPCGQIPVCRVSSAGARRVRNADRSRHAGIGVVAPTLLNDWSTGLSLARQILQASVNSSRVERGNIDWLSS